MRRGALRIAVVLAVMSVTSVSCAEKGRSTDTRSSSLKSAKERGAFLCGYALCPTMPVDTAFHVTFVDHSRALLPTEDELDLQAVLQVTADDVARWCLGCKARRVDAPPWLGDLAKELGVALKTIPDSCVCGPEERLVHVKEAVVVRWTKRAP